MVIAVVDHAHRTLGERTDAWFIHHEALATWLVGVGTGLLVVGVFVAWVSLKDARHTRHAQLLADLSRRFDEADRRDSTRLFDWYGPSEVVKLVGRIYGRQPQTQEQREEDPKDWFRLCINLNFLEALGVLIRKGLIDAETVYLLWGPNIMNSWFRWKTSIATLRILSETPQSYWHVQYLDAQMRRVDARRAELQPPFKDDEAMASAATAAQAIGSQSAAARAVQQKELSWEPPLQSSPWERAVWPILAVALAAYVWAAWTQVA